MIIKLPIDIVDSYTKFLLAATGYKLWIQSSNVIYWHSIEGMIKLRKLDDESTEISFSDPYYPELSDVIPSGDASIMEAKKIVEGVEYPKHVIIKLEEEYNRRVAAKNSRIVHYCKELQKEDERIRGITTLKSNNLEQQINGYDNSQSANYTEAQPLLLQKAVIEDLSFNELLCLAWVNRDVLDSFTLDEFLSKVDRYISVNQFKYMLQLAGRKGILVKQNKLWKPAPKYSHLNITIRNLLQSDDM
jgi:hypothetical protein